MFPAVPSAPIKSRRTNDYQVRNDSVIRNLSSSFEKQALIECYYYHDDIEQKHTYTIEELLALTPVEHPVYGPVYCIMEHYWFSCNNRSVLSNYHTITCVQRIPVLSDHRLFLGEKAVLVNLLCYTEDDVRNYSKPSLVLRMPINPCDANQYNQP